MHYVFPSSIRHRVDTSAPALNLISALAIVTFTCTITFYCSAESFPKLYKHSVIYPTLIENYLDPTFHPATTHISDSYYSKTLELLSQLYSLHYFLNQPQEGFISTSLWILRPHSLQPVSNHSYIQWMTLYLASRIPLSLPFCIVSSVLFVTFPNTYPSPRPLNICVPWVLVSHRSFV